MGKTTCAAIEAVDAARTGPTLLVTTDPASSLTAVLDVQVGPDPAPVHGAPRLHATNVDAARAFRRWLDPRRDLLASIALRGTYLDEEDVSRLLNLSLPGIDEIIGLVEVARLARDAHYETVVVDTAPTGHTLRLLAAPALLGRVAAVLDLLQSHHRMVVSALRGRYAADAADALIAELNRDGETAARMLRDPALSRITWVTLPEPMALEETADALQALDAAEIPVGRLIVNRIVRRADRCEWCQARARFEARAVAPLARRFAGREVLSLPELPREPRGIASLRAAAAQIVAWRPPKSMRPPRKRVRAPIRGVPFVGDLAGRAIWLLFGGKGGVGKSTCAAAEAVHLARSRRVLLLSTDPAHSLGDVFGTRIGDRPRTIPGAPGTLWVREIDAAAEMRRFRQRYVEAVDAAFTRIARSVGSDPAMFRELIDLAPPGIDEVIAVAEVAETLASRRRVYDLVLTDTAPTGHALRLLQTPALLREWTQALMSILLKYREVTGAGALGSMLVQLSRRLRAVHAILADARRTRFIIVARAASVPVSESEELLASLRGLGIAVTAVVVNALGRGECAACRAAGSAESKSLMRLRRSLAGSGPWAMIGTPAEVPPPHGAAALLAWRRAWRQIA